MGVFSADNGGVVGISPWLTKWKRLVCGLKEDDKRIRDELHDLIDNKDDEEWENGKRKQASDKIFAQVNEMKKIAIKFCSETHFLIFYRKWKTSHQNAEQVKLLVCFPLEFKVLAYKSHTIF